MLFQSHHCGSHHGIDINGFFWILQNQADTPVQAFDLHDTTCQDGLEIYTILNVVDMPFIFAKHD